MLFPGMNEKKKTDADRFQMVRINLGNNNRLIGIKLPTKYWIEKVKNKINEKIEPKPSKTALQKPSKSPMIQNLPNNNTKPPK